MPQRISPKERARLKEAKATVNRATGEVHDPLIEAAAEEHEAGGTDEPPRSKPAASRNRLVPKTSRRRQ